MEGSADGCGGSTLRGLGGGGGHKFLEFEF